MYLTGLNFVYTQDHFLVINPDGHKSTIYDMDIDKKGNIITGSFDKTVKVWDSKKGIQLKEFRGQIGKGSEGFIYAVALSPNQKHLAIGGWLGKDDETERLGEIRIYDYESGKLEKLISNKMHENVIQELKFTNDSKYLLAGDGDGNVVQWEVATKIPVTIYETSYSGVNSISIAEDYFVSTHKNGEVLQFQYLKAKPIKKFMYFTEKKLKDFHVETYSSISSDGKKIAIAGKEVGMILILDEKMKLKQYFFTGDNNIITDLNFSPSGNRLITAIKEPSKNRAEVYELMGKTWEKIVTYSNHDATLLNTNFINENTCVSTGGFKNEIAIWDIKNDKVKELHVMKGIGQTYYSASLNGMELAYGLVANKAYGFANHTHQFNLFSRQDEKLKNAENFTYPIIEKNGYSLKEKNPTRKSDWDPYEVLEILEKGVKKASINRYPWTGNTHRTYGFVGNDFIVSGGDYGILEAFDYEGKIVSHFIGHEDAVSGISISNNSKYLVSCSYDNTIRLWKIADIGKEQQELPKKSVWKYLSEQFLEYPWHDRIKSSGLEKKAKELNFESWNEVIEKLQKNGYQVGFLKDELYNQKSGFIYPVVSIFVASNNEWVIWNNDGYFTSSKKGAKFIGYHVNQGKNMAAKFYPFEQFDLKYNRPDIIYTNLELADKGIIDLYHKAYLKRLKKMGMQEEDLHSDIHVPTLKIESYKQEDNTLKIDFKAFDEKYNLNRINVYQNDVPIYGRNGIDISSLNKKEITQSITIELLTGENKIQISTLNENGTESFKETIFMNFSNENSTSDLYIVSLGVSKYKDERFNLKYAAKDAEDISTVFENQSIYETVHQLVLINEKVTKENIYQIKDFLQNSKTNDVVVLFIAGHGVLNKEFEYYFCTHDIDFNEPEKRGVSYGELEQLFDGIKAIKKLLLMDTCHSGEVDKDEIEEIELDKEEGDIIFRTTQSTTALRERQGLKKTNEAVKEMFNDLSVGTGTTVISSAGGVEFAMESDQWKNGLFTYCLLEGIASKEADLNKDGKIFVSEIQIYVRNKVFDLSKGKQNSGSRFENISLDYPLW